MNDFERFSVVNRQRAMRWHKGGLDEWSVTDWSNAFAGEAGELCNAVKKFRRVQDRIQGGDGDTPQRRDLEQAIYAIGKEIGDAYAYLDLLAQRFDLMMWNCIAVTFDQISQREGFSERAPVLGIDDNLVVIRAAAQNIAEDRDTERAIETILKIASGSL